MKNLTLFLSALLLGYLWGRQTRADELAVVKRGLEIALLNPGESKSGVGRIRELVIALCSRARRATAPRQRASDEGRAAAAVPE